MAKSAMAKSAMAILAAATLALGLTACTSTDNQSTADTSSEVLSEVSTEALSEVSTDDVAEAAAEDDTTDSTTKTMPQTEYPVEITDSYGDVITLEAEPERVVSVAPNLTELMYKLGASDKLVGRSDYCDYPEEVSEIESVGSLRTPDIEKIISLEPDVVIVSTHFDEENTKKLEEVGIPVITLYEEHDVEGVYDMITILGTAINRNSEAAQCVSEMKNTIKEVVNAVEEVERPSVYYVVGYGEYGDYTAGGDTFVGGLIELAGGDNIAKDVSGWSITLEEIVEADPSIIVISEDMKEGFMSDSNYENLTAVKEGCVYTIDTNLLDRQGYRNAQGVKALAEIFHPEVFE
jgi:iron complex transport system substrate-binding protein